MPYGKVFIYGLRDPQTKRFFYIGRSQRPQSRFAEHCAEATRYQMSTMHPLERLFGIDASGFELEDALQEDGWGELSVRHLSPKIRESNVKKCKWILDLWERELEPEFEILDEWVAPTKIDANRLEDAWIASMRAKRQPLTNVIYSHRMNPNWYGPANKRFKEGWPRDPDEYIARLKSGTVATVVEEGDDATEREGAQLNITQKKRIADRIARTQLAARRAASSVKKSKRKAR